MFFVFAITDAPDDAAALDELAPPRAKRWERYLGSRAVLLDAAAAAGTASATTPAPLQ